VTYRNTTIEDLINEKFGSNEKANNSNKSDSELYDLVCCSEVIEHVND